MRSSRGLREQVSPMRKLCLLGRRSTNNAMNLERRWRSVFIASVLEQGEDVALVVNLDGLLGGRRVIAGWHWLEDEAVDCGKDEDSPGEAEHLQGLQGLQGLCSLLSEHVQPRHRQCKRDRDVYT